MVSCCMSPICLLWQYGTLPSPFIAWVLNIAFVSDVHALQVADAFFLAKLQVVYFVSVAILDASDLL